MVGLTWNAEKDAGWQRPDDYERSDRGFQIGKRMIAV